MRLTNAEEHALWLLYCSGPAGDWAVTMSPDRAMMVTRLANKRLVDFVAEKRGQGEYAVVTAEGRDVVEHVLAGRGYRIPRRAHESWHLANEETRRVTKKQIFRTVTCVVMALRDEDRKPRYRGHPDPFAGQCYVASQAIYYMLGGRKSGWHPAHMRVGNDTHWWLENDDDEVIDPTAAQFNESLDYSLGRRSGWLHVRKGKDVPDRRTAAVIERALWWMKA